MQIIAGVVLQIHRLMSCYVEQSSLTGNISQVKGGSKEG